MRRNRSIFISGVMGELCYAYATAKHVLKPYLIDNICRKAVITRMATGLFTTRSILPDIEIFITKKAVQSVDTVLNFAFTQRNAVSE